MSSWTYRVTQEKDPDGSIVLSIRECWAREGAEKPYQDSDYTSWSENSIAPIGSTLDELKWELQKMLEACDNAIIDIDAKKHQYQAILEKVPDVDPEPYDALPKISKGKWYAMFEDRGIDCIAEGGFDTEEEAKAVFTARVNYALFIPDDKILFTPDYRYTPEVLKLALSESELKVQFIDEDEI